MSSESDTKNNKLNIELLNSWYQSYYMWHSAYLNSITYRPPQYQIGEIKWTFIAKITDTLIWFLIKQFNQYQRHHKLFILHRKQDRLRQFQLDVFIKCLR